MFFFSFNLYKSTVMHIVSSLDLKDEETEDPSSYVD